MLLHMKLWTHLYRVLKLKVQRGNTHNVVSAGQHYPSYLVILRNNLLHPTKFVFSLKSWLNNFNLNDMLVTFFYITFGYISVPAKYTEIRHSVNKVDNNSTTLQKNKKTHHNIAGVQCALKTLNSYNPTMILILGLRLSECAKPFHKAHFSYRKWSNIKSTLQFSINRNTDMNVLSQYL